MARRPFSSGSLRTISSLALLGALLAVPRPASAAQDPALYFVCEVPTRGVSPGTTYLSDVIGPVGLTLNNKSVFVVLNEEFQKFVADTYGHNAAAACSRFTDENNARAALAQRVAKPPTAMRIVETHWKRAATGTAAPASPVPAQTPQSAKPATSGSSIHGFCSANIPGMTGFDKSKPTYFTPIMDFPRDGDYGAWFGEYVAKKYAFLPAPAYSCARGNGPISGLEAEMQKQMANAKARGAGAVQTDWTSDTHKALMADLAKNAPAKPAPAPAAKKADPDDDAPPPAKPATATNKPAGAAPAPAKPAPQAPALYSYCYGYGKPTTSPTGPTKQHFYLTQPFQLALNDRPNQAFQSFLQTAHPGENISASCSGPVPLEDAQKNRQTVFDLRKKQSSSYDVVEVDWKFVR